MSIRHLLYRRVSHPLKIPEERELLSPVCVDFMDPDESENKGIYEINGFQFNQQIDPIDTKGNDETPFNCTETQKYDPNYMSYHREFDMGENFIRIGHRRRNRIDDLIARNIPVINITTGVPVMVAANRDITINQDDVENISNEEYLSYSATELNPDWLTGLTPIPSNLKEKVWERYPIIKSLKSIRYEDDESEEKKIPKSNEEDEEKGIWNIKLPLILCPEPTEFQPSVLDQGAIFPIKDPSRGDNYSEPELQGTFSFPTGDKASFVPQCNGVSIIYIGGRRFYVEDGKAICYSKTVRRTFTFQQYMNEFPPYHLAAYGYMEALPAGIFRAFGWFDLYDYLIGNSEPYYSESRTLSDEKEEKENKKETKRERRKGTNLFEQNVFRLIDPISGSINHFTVPKQISTQLDWEDLERLEGLGFISTIRSAEQLQVLNQLLNQIPFGKTSKGTEKKLFTLKGKIPFASTEDHLLHIRLGRQTRRWQGGFFDPRKGTLTISMEVIYFALMKEYPELKDRIGIQSNFRLKLDTSMECSSPSSEFVQILNTFYEVKDKTTDILSPLIQYEPNGLCLLPEMWTFPVATSLKYNWDNHFASIAQPDDSKDESLLIAKERVVQDHADRYICLALNPNDSGKTTHFMEQLSQNFTVNVTFIFPSPRLLEALYDLGQKLEMSRKNNIIRLDILQGDQRKEIFKSLFYKQN